MKVGVLLATYNGEGFVRQQITSILTQTDVNVDIFISDDMSTDATMEIIGGLMITHSNIKIISSQKKYGSASANFFNLLLTAPFAGYDYIALADQDDVWHTTRLSEACQQLALAGCGFYSSATQEGRDQDGSLKIGKILTQKSKPTDLDFLFEGAGQGCTFVFSVDFAEVVRLSAQTVSHRLSRLHYHDWFIYLVARINDVTWVYDDAPTLIYRQHSLNDTGSRLSFSGVKQRLGMIASGWYRSQLESYCDVAHELGYRSESFIAYRNAFFTGETAGRLSWKSVILIALKSRRRKRDRAVVLIGHMLRWI